MRKDEFEILAKRLRGKLLALARDFALPSGTEADDVVQEAMVELWKLDDSGYPIFIVDSEVVPPEDYGLIKPENIANVNVFKGDSKAATDTYGEKGRNGVIVVKTKGAK